MYNINDLNLNLHRRKYKENCAYVGSLSCEIMCYMALFPLFGCYSMFCATYVVLLTQTVGREEENLFKTLKKEEKRRKKKEKEGKTD